MTCIATDGLTIAADSLETMGTEKLLRSAKKIIEIGGVIYASSGIGTTESLAKWHQDGADPRDPPRYRDEHWALLVINHDGTMHLFTALMPYAHPIVPPFALGTGGDYAMGAMLAGASAERAVEIACEIDTACGGEIVVMEIPQAQREAAE